MARKEKIIPGSSVSLHVSISKVMMKTLKSIFVHKKSCCKLVLIGVMLFSCRDFMAQEVIQIKTVIDSAVNYSPRLKGANAAVSQQQHLLKSAINLPNPEILLQNPTGHFYTIGVQQIF